MPEKLKWKLKKVPGGWHGYITLPTGGRGLTVRSITPKPGKKGKSAAIAEASDLASAIADNPILKSMLPPGSGVALKAAGKLAKAVNAGEGAKYLAKLTGKGAKRLVKKLKFW